MIQNDVLKYWAMNYTKTSQSAGQMSFKAFTVDIIICLVAVQHGISVRIGDIIILMILYAEERPFSHALANTQFCFSTAPPCLYSLA